MDHRYLENADPDARLTFTFKGQSVFVRARRGPQAGTMTWRVDGRPAEQRATLTGAPGWEWVGLAAKLDGREHSVDIGVVSSGGTVAIDGFRVDADGAALGRRSWQMATVLLMGFLALVIAIDGRHVLRRLPPR